jgi:hypothetical protein
MAFEPFEIPFKFTFTEQHNMLELLERMRETGITADFKPAQIVLPAREFADDFVEHILQFGFSSLFSNTMVFEEITSPSMTINVVEAIVSRFVQKLMPAKRLVIIDPYFYAPNDAGNTDQLLMRLIGSDAADIEDLYVFSEGNGSMKAPINAALMAIAPSIRIHHKKTAAFHDRFWLNPDTGTGIVMGTSLGGLGRRIALVDKLSGQDAADVLAEVRKLDSTL